MSKIIIENNEIDDNIYINRKSFYFKVIIIGLILIFAGIFSAFPVKETLVTLVADKLNISSNCKIAHSKIHISFFLPQLSINKPTLPISCINPNSLNRNKSIKFSSWKFAFDAFSFSPIGIRTKLQLKSKKTNIILYPTISFAEFLLTIKNTKVDFNIINQITGKENLLSGNFVVNGVFKANTKSLVSGKLLVKSTNFRVNKANIQGFELKKLDIKNISLKAQLKNKTNLTIKQLILGDKSSPIIASAKGKIKLNQKNINNSKIDLNSEIKFSEAFIKDYSFINLFFKGDKSETGFYKIKLSGTIGRPNPPEFL